MRSIQIIYTITNNNQNWGEVESTTTKMVIGAHEIDAFFAVNAQLDAINNTLRTLSLWNQKVSSSVFYVGHE